MSEKMTKLEAKLKLDAGISKYEWKIKKLDILIKEADLVYSLKNDEDYKEKLKARNIATILKVQKDDCEKYIRDYNYLRKIAIDELLKRKVMRYVE